MTSTSTKRHDVSAPPPRGGLPLAREGWPFVLGGLGAGALLIAAGFLWHPALGFVGALPFVFGLFSLWFFRDPERALPADPALLVSPADGKVTLVEESGAGLRISIFLNVFDVHVNRSPCEGVVRDVTYTPGQFAAAFRPDVAEINERNAVLLETPHGAVRVVQIAGLIARRIVCRAAPEQSLARGERFGLIRFGSCTELHLPVGAEPLVSPGQRVRGGATAIARWRGAGPGAAS